MTSPSQTMQQPWMLLFLLVAAIWGGSFMFMQAAALELGAIVTACLRMAIGALVMLPLLWWRGLLPQLVQHWRIIFGISLVNAAIPFACYAFAVMHISTGLSAILNATTPMFTALVAWLWLGQGLSRLRMSGVVIGFVGVALLVSEQAGLKGPSMWLSIAAIAACLVATLCYAVSGNAIKTRLTQLHPWVIAGGTMLGAALWLLIPALLAWPSASPSIHAWVSLGIVGTVCSAVAFMLYFELMQRVDIARTASVTYLIPVFALGYAALFLEERITMWMLGCGLVVVAGTALATGLIKPKASAA